jgi:dissimilatory sulfite reductase (desulfoviridin) alpha/beta subunit
MKVRITRVSKDYDPEVKGSFVEMIKGEPRWFIEVNTIQDILDLAKKYKASIIIHRSGPELEIYDGYRE